MQDATQIEVDLSVREANTEIAHVQRFTSIATPEDKRHALESLKVLSEKHRTIDAQRKKVATAQDEAKKAALAVYLQPLRDLKKEIDRLRNALGVYEEAVLIERKIAMEAATAALAAGDHSKMEAVIAQSFGGDAGNIDGSYNRTDWKYEIVDASLLPREFLQANETLIGATVRDQKEETQIPGVRVWSEIRPVVRSVGGAA